MKGRSVGQKNNKKVRALPRLKEELQRRYITQYELACMIGYSENGTYRIINRKRGSMKAARLIAKALDMNQAELFEVIR